MMDGRVGDILAKNRWTRDKFEKSSILFPYAAKYCSGFLRALTGGRVGASVCGSHGERIRWIQPTLREEDEGRGATIEQEGC